MAGRLSTFSLLVLLVVACSSESGLVGNGACDAFCAKVDVANCRIKAAHDDCVAECVRNQWDPSASRIQDDPQACSEAESKMIRCATIDGNVGCDGSTGSWHVVGCDPAVSAQRDACLPFTPDAGPGRF